MEFSLAVWRAAAHCETTPDFVERVGALALEGMRAESVVIRALDHAPPAIETLAAIRQGVVGARPINAPIHPLDDDDLSRIKAALATVQRASGSQRHGPAWLRAALSGLEGGRTRPWTALPLQSGGETLGLLAVQGLGASMRDEVVAFQEAAAAVLARHLRRRALERVHEAAEADKEAALGRLKIRDVSPSVIGADAGLREVMEQVATVAATDTPVLILGETGSGKEVVARAIHERSKRAAGPVLRVNCGAIPPELVDSELFGHERGAFTGAHGQRVGWFERADGGTLFLDEIGELPVAAQVRLLRVLQDGVYERVGGQRSRSADVRVVAATHRDLPSMVRQGRFREDLWYRIAVFSIRLPSLRERKQDIPALVRYFAQAVGQRYGSGVLKVSERDLALLAAYDWPGNVRELGAVIERAAVLGEGRRLDFERAMGAAVVTGPRASATRPAQPVERLDDVMRRAIEQALRAHRNRIDGPRGAARALGLHPNTLRSKMERLGLHVRSGRGQSAAP